MKQIIAASAVASAILAVTCGASARGIVHDRVALNIGVNCQWQGRCMKLQREAMRRSLDYVASTNPPHWKLQLCNHNANRGGDRVDWVGFDHCIRNPALSHPSAMRGRHSTR